MTSPSDQLHEQTIHDDTGQVVATTEFTMDCPTCGPATIRFTGGERIPHSCDYRPDGLVIDCADR